MEKKKNVKVIVLIVAIAVVLIGTSAGVMFAFGVFSSDKAKAFDLLKQAPEKMMYTSSGEYIGSTEMTKGMLEHGMNLDVKYSNLKMSGLPETSNGIMSVIDKMEIGLVCSLIWKIKKDASISEPELTAAILICRHTLPCRIKNWLLPYRSF